MNNTIPMTMKINDLAKYSGLSPATIRKMCKEGELEYIMAGRVYYVMVESLMRLVRSGFTR